MTLSRATSFLCAGLILSFAQIHAQSSKKEIQSLEEYFKAFDYQSVLEKGQFLLAGSLLSKSDSLAILEYMLNAAYTLNDTMQAGKIIAATLACSPTFSPNPRITSPKVIAWYIAVKNQYMKIPDTGKTGENVALPQPPMAGNYLKAEYLVATIIFPGSGHLLAKQTTKGQFLSAASAIFLGGIIYSALKTEQYRDAYMNATGDADFDRLYDKYNSTYKTRNALILGYGLLGVYALYDIHSYGQERKGNIVMGFSFQNQAPSFQLSKSW